VDGLVHLAKERLVQTNPSGSLVLSHHALAQPFFSTIS
jgi:hypothetical protein